ncbi:MAG TPA: TolC family protein [Candidatus Binatia bacterium]|nr:TolC family protein [Candidatus Binatia bacterium]
MVASLTLIALSTFSGAASAQMPPSPPPAPPLSTQVAGRVLTLEECIAIALEAQPRIQATLADYAAARYRVNQAMAPLLPQLSGLASTERSQRSVIVTNRNGANVPTLQTREYNDTFDARVQLSQLLFDFGKTLAATEAARKLAEVAVEDVELQRQLISLTVKEAYTNTLFSQRLIRVQQQAIERAELNLRSAKGFFDVGTRPKSDVARAEVDVANARLDLIRARNLLRAAIVALNIAMAIDVDAPLQIVDNLVYQPVTLDRQQLRSDSLRERPEYRQAKLRAAAAEATERQTLRNFFPDISGTGSYGGTQPQLNESWTLGLTLSWSLFDGGGRIARYQEAKANVEGAKARVKSTELDIIQNVEQAEIAVEETQERIQAAQALVASAQENFRLAQGRFDAGVGTILELTDAQLALTQAQNTESQALADYRIALARLDRAVGRR